MHALRQPADVVVRLDHVGLAGLRARGFDDVGIDRALREPLDAGQPLRLLLEHVDEEPADDLALAFRVLFALERREEALRRVDADHADAEVRREGFHDLVALPEPQQAVVDEHAGELVADRAVQERGDDRGVDAAGQAEQHAVAADLLAHARDGVVDDVAGVPERVAAADAAHEPLEDGAPGARVGDLGMELDAVEAPRVVRHRRERRVRRGGDRGESGRQRLDAVAVAHPHVEQRGIRGALVSDAVQQPGRRPCAARSRSRTRGARTARPGRRAARPSSACRSRCRAPARRARTRRPARPAASRRSTDSGPPERTMPRAPNWRTASSPQSQGRISQ